MQRLRSTRLAIRRTRLAIRETRLAIRETRLAIRRMRLAIRRMRLAIRSTLFVVVLAAACVVPAAAAADPVPARACTSADLRYPFQPGGPNDFGVFKLHVSGGSCATAHRVAKAWMQRYEAAHHAGRTLIPRSVAGFRFETVPARIVQAYRELGRNGVTTIGFDYRIPNG